jgi:hypothetical protein
VRKRQDYLSVMQITEMSLLAGIAMLNTVCNVLHNADESIVFASVVMHNVVFFAHWVLYNKSNRFIWQNSSRVH